MAKRLLFLASILLTCSSYSAAQVQVYPVVGLISMIAADKAANDAIAAKSTTTATYRGQSFLMKRTPEEVLTGDAIPRIKQLEGQFILCRNALLADSTTFTCPPERQATIRAAMKYIALVQPTWNQKAYHQEFRFYLAEDKRRQLAAK